MNTRIFIRESVYDTVFNTPEDLKGRISGTAEMFIFDQNCRLDTKNLTIGRGDKERLVEVEITLKKKAST